MIREPAEVIVNDAGGVVLPIGLLAEAGINIGETMLAYSDGDGKITLRRLTDAVADLLGGEPL
ncbi:AbrB/MazE/SpoVT family DNA-binding domain-containing protein [Kitasatospora aureofaciens]|uniref:AbrB/MazE/SpoVT family DNA-binding domain-containing protein n=1 Tax=Kitasatospora aureofaciens TaxID=1894 RepID=UPI0033F25804